MGRFLPATPDNRTKVSPGDQQMHPPNGLFFGDLLSAFSSPLTRGDAPVQRDGEGDEDREYAEAPGKGLPAVRAYWLVEQEASYRVHDLRHRLVVGEGLEPSRHVVRHHEGAGGEGQREEPEKASRLHGLGAPEEERYGGPYPREREAEQQEEPYSPAPARKPGLGPETDEDADHEHHEDDEQVAYQIGDGAARENGGAGRFSRPVRYSSTAAYWPVSPIFERSSPACRSTSSPATSALPASGARSVLRMRTAVVLPAPLGPSRPR